MPMSSKPCNCRVDMTRTGSCQAPGHVGAMTQHGLRQRHHTTRKIQPGTRQLRPLPSPSPSTLPSSPPSN
ncbi:hypothetical protein N7494_010807 [Penicillium frequentans]|uniref:Uncharacterized protein n=1 Tax=Penicillium frequentans TaxID=3151616 RepID=A0AAD6CIF6_9EURO|nr:hypothetical protein N7494_010807 [Penicillium glabrum]